MYAPALPSRAPAAASTAAPHRPMAGATAAIEVAKANNSACVAGLVQRLCQGLRNNVSPQVLDKLCGYLAKGIDSAIIMNDIPPAASLLPAVVKQLIHLHGSNANLQVVITLLMISVKNACFRGWFKTTDAEELINMTNELCSNFSVGKSSAQVELAFALEVISKVILRFYPQFKLVNLIVSLQAKPGYQSLLLDFTISERISREHRVGLFVMQTDNLQTSSCISNPSQVNFLVNGKGVERKNASLENGPQFPLDIKSMLKPGVNFIQTVGYFGGNYVISVATYGKVSVNPTLEEYVQRETSSSVDSDDEIIMASSRISLKCPISFTRIKTPVKGHLCRHYQCFDYDNYIEMNSRKPSWRCPYCNQPVSYVDLRIDREMVKILDKAGKNSDHVIIASDGSWNLDTTEASDGTVSENETDNPSCDAPNTDDSIVDLTMDSDNEIEAGCRSQNEISDRKPMSSGNFLPMENPSESLVGTCTRVAIPSVPAEIRDGTLPSEMPATFTSTGLSMVTALHDSPALGTLESLISGSLPNPIVSDVTPAFRCAITTNYAVTQLGLPTLENTLLGQQNMRTQQSQYHNFVMSDGAGRSYQSPGIQVAPQAFTSVLGSQPNMLMSSTSASYSASSLCTSATTGCVPNPSIGLGNFSSTVGAQSNLLIQSILGNNSAPSSYHSVTMGYATNESSTPGNNDGVPQVLRTANVVCQSSQLQPTIQSEEEQGLWNHQIPRSRNMVGATTSSLYPNLGNPLDHLREVGTYAIPSNFSRHQDMMVSGSLSTTPDNCHRPQAVQGSNWRLGTIPYMSTAASFQVMPNGVRQTRNDHVSNDVQMSSEQMWRPTGGMWRNLRGGASAASRHIPFQHNEPSVSTLRPTYDPTLHIHTLMGIPDAGHI